MRVEASIAGVIDCDGCESFCRGGCSTNNAQISDIPKICCGGGEATQLVASDIWALVEYRSLLTASVLLVSRCSASYARVDLKHEDWGDVAKSMLTFVSIRYLVCSVLDIRLADGATARRAPCQWLARSGQVYVIHLLQSDKWFKKWLDDLTSITHSAMNAADLASTVQVVIVENLIIRAILNRKRSLRLVVKLMYQGSVRSSKGAGYGKNCKMSNRRDIMLALHIRSDKRPPPVRRHTAF